MLKAPLAFACILEANPTLSPKAVGVACCWRAKASLADEAEATEATDATDAAETDATDATEAWETEATDLELERREGEGER